jgi:prevent-host-death family protein
MEAALREPVSITKNGRRLFVLIRQDDYEELVRAARSAVLVTSNQPASLNPVSKKSAHNKQFERN